MPPDIRDVIKINDVVGKCDVICVMILLPMILECRWKMSSGAKKVSHLHQIYGHSYLLPQTQAKKVIKMLGDYYFELLKHQK